MNSKQFTQFIEHYQRPLLSVVYKMVHSWEMAKDIVQESFIRIWGKYKSVGDESSSFYLLYRIAMNLSIDYLRKSKNENDDIETKLNIVYELPKESKELFEIILECASRLKPKQKAAFILRDIEGFDFTEISDVLKTPVENIRSNLNLARKNIKNKLESRYQITEEFFYEL
jgi:RNA polymerase sigma-70 factor, ECF subfamily